MASPLSQPIDAGPGGRAGIARSARSRPAGVVLLAAFIAAGPSWAQDAPPPPLRGAADDAPADPATPPPRPRAARIGAKPFVDGGVATRKVEPAPLRRTAPPALTPPPEPAKRRKAADEDPFAPVGLAFGSFRIRPALELETGFDTNPNRTAGAKKGSARLSTIGEVAGVSDWVRHVATFSIRGGYTAFTSDRGADRPELDAKGALRLDATRDLTVDADAQVKIDTQSPLTTTLPIATSKRPLTFASTIGLGVTQRFNRFSVGLRGTMERAAFGDAEIGGGVVDLSDRNYNTWRAALRFGYELTPGVRPFVEARADSRRYDQEVDSLGFRRSSQGLGLRAGTTFEITRLLTGEIAAGWESRRYADPALTDLRGFVGEASLVWTATPLTTVGLRASSSIDETTLAGLSGVDTRKVSLQVDHAFRRWLTGTAIVSAARTDYGSALPAETTLSGSVRLDYKLSRTLVLRTSFTHERFTTATPGRDYTANILLVGLRLQR